MTDDAELTKAEQAYVDEIAASYAQHTPRDLYRARTGDFGPCACVGGIERSHPCHCELRAMGLQKAWSQPRS